MKPRLALTTLATVEEAEGLARRLVESGLAACVNLVPGVRSYYHWEGKLQQDGEVLLIIKTSQEKWDELQAVFQEHHPYDCPELLLLSPEEVESRYQAWWQNCLGPHHLASTTT